MFFGILKGKLSKNASYLTFFYHCVYVGQAELASNRLHVGRARLSGHRVHTMYQITKFSDTLGKKKVEYTQQ